MTGIRPLVRDPNAKNTESLTRSHLITVSESGLLTCVGGKWTTYREMAEDAVDRAVKEFNLKTQPLPESNISGIAAAKATELDGSCRTHSLRLVGAHGFSPRLHSELVQRFQLPDDVAEHLAHNYGDRAWEVASLTSAGNTDSRRLAGEAFPFVDGEVRYAIRNEYAMTAADIVGRRMRLAFLDVQAALKALPTIISIMGEELKWNDKRRKQEFANAVKFLRSMGLREDVSV